MSDTPICPCDADVMPLPTNLPGLTEIAYRAGTFRDFRRALLTPLQGPPGGPPAEYALTAWRSSVTSDPAVPDPAVMMVEWWAYLADILTFYNERIANESYLGTTMLPESPARLISLLGYRPKPPIGATGTLAALVTPGQSATLPAGLQFQSKPGPGLPPQTFELLTATPISAPDIVAANPAPPSLVSMSGGNGGGSGTGGGSKNGSLLLRGSVTSVSAGALLLLGLRDDTVAPTLATLSAPPSVESVVGGKQTLLSLKFPEGAPPNLTAAGARLQRAGQNIGLWTVNAWSLDPGAVDSSVKVIQLAGLARQIRPNDWVVFTAPGVSPQLVQVSGTTDMLGDASKACEASATSVGTAKTHKPTPIPVLHTQLTINSALSSGFHGLVSGTGGPAGVTVLFGWIEVGTLIDQPPGPWDGTGSNGTGSNATESSATEPALTAVQPAVFAEGTLPIILQDAAGVGVLGTGTSSGDGNLTVGWPSDAPAPLSPTLQPPLDIFYNLLSVTRGKTVSNEALGSGDATIPGQSFMLSQSPVTYLMSGSSYASTIRLTVNGVPWTEVPAFYGQSSSAQVFITREDDQGNTHVDFGDGVNGARLPTGAAVLATYRVGAGAASPPAGKLTVIAQAYPGLRAVSNPIAVSGGSDADPPSLLKECAPRSVLTFGRAVSIFDYQAIAAQACGVTMALSVWSWEAAHQRAVVCVYVAGAGDVVGSATALLSAASDPNRPVIVRAATPVYVQLAMNLIYTPGMDTGGITTAVQAALADPVTGLFAPANLSIGQALFDSQIESACMGVSGVVAIGSATAVAASPAITFTIGSASTAIATIDPGPLHAPGAGSYYVLSEENVQITLQANPYG